MGPRALSHNSCSAPGVPSPTRHRRATPNCKRKPAGLMDGMLPRFPLHRSRLSRLARGDVAASSLHDMERSIRLSRPGCGGSEKPSLLWCQRGGTDECCAGWIPHSTAPRPLCASSDSDPDQPGGSRRRPPQLHLGPSPAGRVCDGCFSSTHPPLAVCVSPSIAPLPLRHTGREREGRLCIALVAVAR